MKIYAAIFMLLIICCLTNCYIGAGTHGSLKGYIYPTTKTKLESAIAVVISKNKNIVREDNKAYIVDVTNGKNDTIYQNYYNDGTNYMTITIKGKDLENKYIFRYYGDEKHWERSPNSEIFICYAHNKEGEGGSEGQGNVSNRLKNKLSNTLPINS